MGESVVTVGVAWEGERVSRADGVLVLDVETDQVLAGCASCGVVAVGHGRRVVGLHDAPCFGRPVLMRWRKRVWRCAEQSCPVSTWTEDHGYAAKRSKLTTRRSPGRPMHWARRHHGLGDRASSGVDWNTAWAAIKAEATRRVGRPERLKG